MKKIVFYVLLFSFCNASVAWDRREQLEIQQQEQNIKLFKEGLSQTEDGEVSVNYDSPAGQQIRALQGLQSEMDSYLTRQATATLMRRFTDSGGDANVIMKAMHTNPGLKEAFNSRGATAFANINMADPGDIEMLKREGITQEQLNDPEFVKEFGKNTWKSLSPEGEWRTGLLRNLLSEVGSGTYDMDPDLFEDIEHSYARLAQLFKGTDLEKQDRDADLKDREFKQKASLEDRTLAQQVNREGRAADNEDEKTRLTGVNNKLTQGIDFLRAVTEGKTADSASELAEDTQTDTALLNRAKQAYTEVAGDRDHGLAKLTTDQNVAASKAATELAAMVNKVESGIALSAEERAQLAAIASIDLTEEQIASSQATTIKK